MTLALSATDKHIVARVCGVQTGHSALWEEAPWDHPIVTKDRSHQTPNTATLSALLM